MSRACVAGCPERLVQNLLRTVYLIFSLFFSRFIIFGTFFDGFCSFLEAIESVLQCFGQHSTNFAPDSPKLRQWTINRLKERAKNTQKRPQNHKSQNLPWAYIGAGSRSAFLQASLTVARTSARERVPKVSVHVCLDATMKARHTRHFSPYRRAGIVRQDSCLPAATSYAWLCMLLSAVCLLKMILCLCPCTCV